MLDTPSPEPARRLPRIRNPRTQAKIRRDVIWQIGLPLGLAVVGGLVLLALVISPGGATTRSAWADVSIIFLIIPTALFGLISLALIAGLVFAAYYGLRELPFLFRIVQDYTVLASSKVRAGADKASGVVLSIRSFTTGVGRAARDVRDFFGRGGA
jgi:hypothetical protein